MFEKYVRRFGANAFLTPEEAAWLSEHGTIRVGYQDNYMAFCAKDPKTGELTGALRDYLDCASECLSNARINFEAAEFPTSADAMKALKKGEVDCVFPANLGSYDGKKFEVVMTPALMRTDMYAVIRSANKDFFAKREHVIVAVNEGNPNYNAFLQDNYPDWRVVYYPDTAECLKVVSEGRADCVLISSYRYNNISRLCDKYDLTTFTTGIGMDYCFAVGYGQTTLYSIMAKVIGLIPDSTVNAALSRYVIEDSRLTLFDIIEDHLALVIFAILAVVLVILLLMLRSMRAENRARKLIRATETDDLTGLYNRSYFFQYADRMQKEHQDKPYDAFVVNIEQFHFVNELGGRESGDRILCALADEIRAAAEENGGIAGRFGADRFGIYCRHGEDFQAVFDRLQARLDSFVPGAGVRLRMGVMPWQDRLEAAQQFEMAGTACGMARGHFKEHLVIYDENVGRIEQQNQRLLNDLRRALDSYEFQVYYQPKYDIQADSPALVGAEALVRWQHPELGMLLPDAFVPLFERSGKLGDVDKYVWAEAARKIARWRVEFGLTIPISVNLSRTDLLDPELERTLDDILSGNGLSHDALRLEVTGSAYCKNDDRMIRAVKSLRERGYVVERDDFGTGCSSLNMLSAMPVDGLKMERNFIRNIGENKGDIQLAALIIGAAKKLNIPVTAVGVETESQLKILKDLGCELVQGFVFSRPLPPADFESDVISKAI